MSLRGLIQRVFRVVIPTDVKVQYWQKARVSASGFLVLVAELDGQRCVEREQEPVEGVAHIAAVATAAADNIAAVAAVEGAVWLASCLRLHQQPRPRNYPKKNSEQWPDRLPTFLRCPPLKLF